MAKRIKEPLYTFRQIERSLRLGKRRMILDLKAQDRTYQEIADYFGFSKQNVWDLLQNKNPKFRGRPRNTKKT